MKLTIFRCLCLTAALWICSCATYVQNIEKTHNMFYSGRYPAALDILEKSNIKESENVALLYHMDKGLIHHTSGNFSESTASFLDARKFIQSHYATSVSKELGTYILSEDSQDYKGEAHEQVLINIFLIINFIKQKKFDSALVEVKKVDHLLNLISKEYQDKNSYKGDALARYLAAMIYESQGDYENAYIDYKNCLKIFEQYEKYYPSFTGVPSLLYSDIFRLAKFLKRQSDLDYFSKKFKNVAPVSSHQEHLNNAEIILIHEVGKSPYKKPEEFMIPFDNQLIRFTFPIYRKQAYYIHHSILSIPGKSLANDSILFQDYEEIAITALEERRKLLILKMGARLAGKYLLAKKAEDVNPLLGIAVNLFGAITETADTRSWITLPAKFRISRLLVPPGTYTPQVKFLSMYDQPGNTTPLVQMKVERGKKYFVVMRTF